MGCSKVLLRCKFIQSNELLKQENKNYRCSKVEAIKKNRKLKETRNKVREEMVRVSRCGKNNGKEAKA